MKMLSYIASRDRFARLAAHAPEPALALRWARWCIPVCLVVGLVAAPLARWLLPI